MNALRASMRKEQNTTREVNVSWSVKDNLANITAWQDLLPTRIQSWIKGQDAPEFMPGLKTEDEENEYIYQQNKDRPLAEVEADFQNSYQRAIAAVESVSEEALNTPVKSGGAPLWRYIQREGFEHYEEHADT